MKRNCLFGLLLLTALPLFAENVDPETARKVATTFLKNNGAKTTQLTDLSKEAGFPNLYIFTAEQGFVVMAADDCVKPILGYSLTGSFVVEDMPDNVTGWLQGYSDEIQWGIDNQVRASNETAKLWNDLAEGDAKAGRATTVVAPLIQTKWNQNKYYNNLCPSATGGPDGHAYTGCVATAMAQIMKYHNYPSKGIGSHSYTWNSQDLSADFGETTYDWDNMGLYYEYYFSDANANTNTATWLDNTYHTPEKVAAVATLMYHCGVSINMDYGGGGSSASTEAVATALKTYFNYSPSISYKQKGNFTSDEWIAMVKAELDANRPLQYRGSTGSGGGHSFVCDGYDNNNYFHFNWGWAGSLDGYFSLDNLNTGANTQAGAGNGDYTNNQAAIFGIRPSDNTGLPSNLTYTMEGLQGLTLNWTAASGAASYNIYRNGNLIGNTTETTYSETAPFGTNVYWVRSVDANDELSLSSNNVSVYVSYQTPVVDDLTGTLSGSDASLTWTAPDWCYPETPSATLSYGEDEIYYSWTYVYYAHRYVAADLEQYAGKAVYKVSTYVQYAGTYSAYVYTASTSNNKPDANACAMSKTGITVSSSGWFDFIADEPIILSGESDLWVVMKQENTGQTYPTPSFNLTAHNINAFYVGSSSPTNLNDANSSYNCAWLIKAYLTDGTYTYNLYQDGVKIAGDLNETTYNATLNDNATNVFTLTTNYYGGETTASNTAGFAKGTTSLATLEMGANDKTTVTNGSTLSVSGTLSNDDAAKLIIEDGAQLIHHNDGVKATVKKTIEGYGETEGGWYTIASPFGTFSPTDTPLTSDAFDLYAYDEDGQQEWVNYKAHTSSFNISPSAGYLYARHDGTSLNMTGTLNSGDYTETVNLSYANSNANIKGYNLLGNPTAHDITFTKTDDVADGYYYLANSNNWVYQTGNTVPSGRGFLVKANDSNQSVTLNPQSKENRDQEQYMILSIDDQKTYIKLTDGVSMPLLNFKGRQSNVYLSRNGASYIMLVRDEAETIDLCYRPADGPHTLSVRLEDAELDYLHLVDHLTGADIDLLQSPCYSFESSGSDYPTRFQLLFSEHADSSHNFNGVEFVEGKSQILDLTGRVVATDCNTALAPGIYLLRTINGKDIKTEKIIIK